MELSAVQKSYLDHQQKDVRIFVRRAVRYLPTTDLRDFDWMFEETLGYCEDLLIQWQPDRIRNRMALMAYNKNWKFANISLTAAHRKAFKSWYEVQQVKLAEYTSELLEDGYKIAFRYDDKNDTWMATISSTTTSVVNRDSSMTSRHKDLLLSWGLALFKHFEIAGSGEWDDVSTDETWG